VSFDGAVQNAVFDFHVSAQVALQVELAGAVRTLEGLTSCVEVHVAQEVVHPVEGLPTHLDTPPKTQGLAYIQKDLSISYLLSAIANGTLAQPV